MNNVGVAEIVVLANNGYGILFNPDIQKFCPVTVHDGEHVIFWPDPGDIVDDDYFKAASKLYSELSDSLAEMGDMPDKKSKNGATTVPSGWVYKRDGD